MPKFPKENRLKRKSEIDLLYKQGKRLNGYPVQCKFRVIDNPEAPEVKVMIGCSKKAIKKAVDRNLMKRRIRETFAEDLRELKDLAKKENIKLNFSLIYCGKELSSFQDLKPVISNIVSKLSFHINK